MAELKKGPRGLPSIARAREERSRRGARWTTQAGLVAAGAVILGYLANSVVSGSEVSAGKHSLLAKQFAVQATLGAQWSQLRRHIEEDIVGAGGPYPGDHIEPQARGGGFRVQPGLYLRIRFADARDSKSIARVAADSKKDAFVACLMREPNDRGLRGDLDGGAFAEQPWNLGLAYSATRILTEEWVSAVKAADGDMRLRVFADQYDKAMRDEIPVAIEIVKRAQFFLLVLDEDDADGETPVGGPPTEEALQLVPHPAQVHLFDLRANKEILRLRRSGGARLIPAGDTQPSDPEIRDAMQRQANNCALGRQVESELSR